MYPHYSSFPYHFDIIMCFPLVTLLGCSFLSLLCSVISVILVLPLSLLILLRFLVHLLLHLFSSSSCLGGGVALLITQLMFSVPPVFRAPHLTLWRCRLPENPQVGVT